jgi:hypothetical protein
MASSRCTAADFVCLGCVVLTTGFWKRQSPHYQTLDLAVMMSLLEEVD